MLFYNLCLAAPSSACDPTSLVTFENFHGQPQKRVREVCCPHVRTNVFTWVGIVYDYAARRHAETNSWKRFD